MKSINIFLFFRILTSIISFPSPSLPSIYSILSKKNISYLKDDEEDEKNSYRGQLFGILREELLSLNLTNVSIGCKETMNYYLFGNNSDDANTTSYLRSSFHIAKLLDDSSKKKNDLLSYDQCMKKNYRFSDTNIINHDKTTRNTYVVVALDKTINRNYSTKNQTLFENYYYLLAFCLPQGYKKGGEYQFINNNKIYYRFCSDDDYKNIIAEVNAQVNYILEFNISDIAIVFSLRNNPDDEEKDNFVFLKLIPAIILLLVVIFSIFRNLILKLLNLICKNENKLKNRVSDVSKSDNEDYDENELQKKLTNNIKNEYSNIYYKNIIKCFSFIENKNELFNFSLTSTKYNNDCGTSNIRGIKGISIFFMLIGWTFVALYHSPLKVYSVRRFHELLQEFFFCFIMYGIRYSPRIILSCSGYTLVYKYLSYLDMNLDTVKVNFLNLSLCFIFYQLHKYILLIMMLLFSRYSFYPLFTIWGENPMWKYLNKVILSKKSNFYFYSSFTSLTFLFGLNKYSNQRESHNLLDYFWLPFNEIFCFIFGVILISIGYHYKCRIDKFILIFVVVCFISKIIFSYIYKIFSDSFNSTLYYYFFDYGRFMTNPLFNIIYFLIGLYFGLMNYTVQKGIVDLKISKTYEKFQKYVKDKNLELIEKNEKDDNETTFKEDNEKSNNNNENNNNNNVDYNDYCEEIKMMPFLIAPIIFVKWHRRHKMKYFFAIILIIFLILFISFLSLNYIIIWYRGWGDYENSLEIIDYYINNDLINFVYRIDIELVVLLIQWGAFIIYFKGNNILADFLTHQFWTMLSKPYFSFILIINPVLLFIFYQGETLIGLNSLNLILYSIIAGFFTFVAMCFGYILFELPLKRVSHLIINGNWINEDDIEQNDEYEEDKSFDGIDNKNISKHRKNY